MKKQSLFLLGFIGLMLSGCASTKLEPGAENVIVTDKSHAPSECKSLGQVNAFDTNGSSVTYTSHERLQQYQINILKNKTVDLGGNVLVITDHETTYVDASEKEPDLIDTHFMKGNAYLCTTKQLKSIVVSTSSESDETPKEAAEG